MPSPLRQAIFCNLKEFPADIFARACEKRVKLPSVRIWLLAKRGAVGYNERMEALRSFFTEHVLAYGTFAALGIVAAFVCALLLCFRMRQNWVRQIPMMLLSLFGLVLGAKLFGMLSYATYLRAAGIPREEITLRRLFDDSGIVFYGGLLGYLGTLALLFWKLLPKKRLGWDIVAASTPLFHAIARVGCYFAHDMIGGELVWHPCCYGVKMDNAFCAAFWDGRLPVQLFESAFNFGLFLALLLALLRDRRPERRGKRIDVYLAAYALFRFVIEFFRGDEVRGGLWGLAFSQVVSLLILFAVALKLILRRKGVLPVPPPDPYDPEVDLFDLFHKGEPEAQAEAEPEPEDNAEPEAHPEPEPKEPESPEP